MEVRLAHYAGLVNTNRPLRDMREFVETFRDLPREEQRALLEKWHDLFDWLMDEPTDLYGGGVTIRFLINSMGFEFVRDLDGQVRVIERRFSDNELNEVYRRPKSVAQEVIVARPVPLFWRTIRTLFRPPIKAIEVAVPSAPMAQIEVPKPNTRVRI